MFHFYACLGMMSASDLIFIQFNVTEHPTAEWTAQLIIDAFPDNEAPRYLLRDRDGIYGEYFRNRVRGMGIDSQRVSRSFDHYQ